MKRVIITIGDPSGIGPEICVKAWELSRAIVRDCELVFVGDPDVIKRDSHMPSLKINVLNEELSNYDSEALNLIDCGVCKHKDLSRNEKMRDLSAKAAAAYLDRAISEIKSCRADGLVTAPVNKRTVGMVIKGFTGHTEYLAGSFGVDDYTMMLSCGYFRVSLVTRHIPLSRVSEAVNRDAVTSTVINTYKYLKRNSGDISPLICVCGLNPHSGEEGDIGREEIDTILPALESLPGEIKSSVRGPESPDAVFYRAYRGEYDAVVCMYHDQGLIPLKMVGRDSGVNITLGLPFCRTSPDHGSGYDIAGKGIADPSSMVAAIFECVNTVKTER